MTISSSTRQSSQRKKSHRKREDKIAKKRKFPLAGDRLSAANTAAQTTGSATT
jgi:hypothetical protein